MKRLGARESLNAAGLTPGANMYLGFDGAKPAAPYLEASLVAQLGPAPEVRGVNAYGGVEIKPTFSGEAMGWGAGQKLGSTPPAAAPAAERSWGSGHRLGGGPAPGAGGGGEPTPMHEG
eukprot:TRINITY_DN19435_c0_g2_i5.p2 TRINITY_DN19435_c0_g2~~TRINITY_DN19435_c0_g2_i5.p2  ORF type:complete len:119 (+),score=25.42 TRINITY_DN19435_c0_g2_i5:489-845(+)